MIGNKTAWNKRLIRGGAVLFLAGALIAEAVEGASTRPVLIADYDYVLAVPPLWETKIPAPGGTMKLHLLVPPARYLFGHFTVHVSHRGRTSTEAWIAFNQKEFLDRGYGETKVDSMEILPVGPYEGRLLHVRDLKGREGYGLWEALVFTEDHVLFLNYLYDGAKGGMAREEMERILSSLSSDPDRVAQARRWYERGRSLGMERLGIFLSLPSGWIPERAVNKDQWVVALPSGGSLRINFFSRIMGGIEGLKKNILRCLPHLPLVEGAEIVLGTSASRACRYTGPDTGDDAKMECILGGHGPGGYALILETRSDAERELFKKVCAEAVLVDPKRVDDLRKNAQALFRKAVKGEEIAEAEESLGLLELFSWNRSAVQAVERGLLAGEEIQKLCALALGRMGSREASRVLEKAVKNRRMEEEVKKHCIRALGMIGGEREKAVLERLDRQLHASFSPDLQHMLNETLESLSQ